MTVLRWLYVLVVNVLCMTVGLYAQDVVYSQFYNAPIQLNPSLVGMTNHARVAVNYRDQWVSWAQNFGSNGGYQHFSASYDQFFEYANSGVGFQILNDNAGNGIYSTTQFNAVYAYQLQINPRLQIRMGLEGIYFNQSLNWDQLVFLDQITDSPEVIGPSDEARPEDLSTSHFDIGFGALLFNKNYYLGISLKHLNSPDNVLTVNRNGLYAGLPPRFTLHAGGQIDLDGYNNEGFGTFFAPSVLFTTQAETTQLNAGGLLNRENIFVGGWLRYNFSNIDAAIISVGYRSEVFKLSYSFDATLSQATLSSTAGSHEVGIIINIGVDRFKGTDYDDCFSIFR